MLMTWGGTGRYDREMIRALRSVTPNSRIRMLPYRYVFGPFTLDPTRRLFFKNGDIVPLAPKLFDILLLLVQANGRLVAKDEFLMTVWNGETVGEGSLSQHVFLLRRTLGEHPSEHRFILTVQGKGYRFVAPVALREAPEGGLGTERAAALGDLILHDRFVPFRLYCEGCYYLEQRTETALHKAIDVFDRALELDNRYAPAHVGLALAYCQLGEYLFEPPARVFARAKEAATKALQMDKTSGDAHAVMAETLIFSDRDWQGAQRESDLALALDESSTFARHGAAWLTLWRGDYPRALAEIQGALRMSPSSLLLATTLGWILTLTGDYGRAIGHLRDILARESAYAIARYYLAQALILSGAPNDAIAVLENQDTAEFAQQNLAVLGYAHARAGNEATALRCLAELRDLGTRRYVSPYTLAMLHAGLNRRERALELLEEADRAGAAWLAFLRTDPLLAPLRDDPRYLALMQ
ncbi:MAG: winged helix-turn-helix domain-containing protein [Vulcanimicrobiaceae bacterium]